MKRTSSILKRFPYWLVFIAFTLLCAAGTFGVEPPENDSKSVKPVPGVILAWNNIYPEGTETARWYAEEVGFTGSYMHVALACRFNEGHLLSGVRLYPGKYASFKSLKKTLGTSYLHRKGRRILNPYHPEVLATVNAYIDKQFGNPILTPIHRADIRYILLDSESVLAPPNVSLEGLGQKQAVAIITEAARAAGVLGKDEPLPRFSYGIVSSRDKNIYTEEGALKSASPQMRILEWWFAEGGGPGRIWKPVMEKIRSHVPKVYASTDPICGSDSRPTLPPFGAKAAGLDFVQNWFNINGRADRIPLYSAMMLIMAKTSGLPVVQGPQLFNSNSNIFSYREDLLLTSNLLTLSFNPRNGSDDPDAPWGVVHWGFRPLTKGAKLAKLKGHHKNAEGLLKNLERNRGEVMGAIGQTRRFMEQYGNILKECEDLPTKVALVLPRGGFYVAPGGEWWTFDKFLSSMVYPLLMAHVPFKMINETDDISKYDLVVLPRANITDIFLKRLQSYKGKVTGEVYPEKVRKHIPGWVPPLSANEVGRWPYGGQGKYLLGGHSGKIDAQRRRLWLRDRTAKYLQFYEGLIGPLEVIADPEVIVNVVKWGDKRVLFAINHHFETNGDPLRADRCVPLETDVTLRGHYLGGTHLTGPDRTRFHLSFAGAGAKVIVLEQATAK